MSNELVTRSGAVSAGVDSFSTALVSYLTELGLPTERVLVAIPERQKVINNLNDVISAIEPQKRLNSLYLSKFVAACGAGLFDAALNFIWDETVVNLRGKVARFDLEYFYDSVVTDPTRRAKLKDEVDLVKIEEWELVRGCHLTGILSDIGFKHLDYIRDMRNWASAAHPNQNELTGFQLVSWLETCIKEVIAKEPESAAIEVKRFLNSIRTGVLAEMDVVHIKAGMEHLPSDIIISLLRTFFGMYTTANIAVQIRANIKLIAEKCWDLSPDDAKFDCGLRYVNFAANGEVDRKNFAHEFLVIVNGLPYLPSDTLALEISEKINNLYAAHNGFNNFHNEPTHAKALASYISSAGIIPESVRKSYVQTITMTKIGNGYGVSNMAEYYYDAMIQKFGEPEIKEFIKLLTSREFSSRISIGSCTKNYRTLVAYLKTRTTNQISLQAFVMIDSATDAQLPNLGTDSRYKRIIDNYS